MITSPLKVKWWEDFLVDLPDPQLKDYLLKGIFEGFCVGFDYHLLSQLRSSSTNLLSATQNPEVVDSYLAKELQLGRIVHIADPLALPFYVLVDDVVSSILLMGCGTLMAKMDIKEAYRMVPVHPEDRLLLGMKWKG